MIPRILKAYQAFAQKHPYEKRETCYVIPFRGRVRFYQGTRGSCEFNSFSTDLGFIHSHPNTNMGDSFSVEDIYAMFYFHFEFFAYVYDGCINYITLDMFPSDLIVHCSKRYNRKYYLLQARKIAEEKKKKV